MIDKKITFWIARATQLFYNIIGLTFADLISKYKKDLLSITLDEIKAGRECKVASRSKKD